MYGAGAGRVEITLPQRSEVWVPGAGCGLTGGMLEIEGFVTTGVLIT